MGEAQTAVMAVADPVFQVLKRTEISRRTYPGKGEAIDKGKKIGYADRSIFRHPKEANTMKKRIIRRVALIVSLLMLVTSTVNTTYGFIVAKTVSLVNIFTPFDSAMSDLVIHKAVEHPFGAGYTVPDNENTVFDFKVELGRLYANTRIKTENGVITADATGALTVSVKANASVGIIGIDAGTAVTVTELTDRDGFTVSGDAVQRTVIPDNGNAKLTFTNVYAPQGTNGAAVDVVGTKNLEGRDWLETDAFTVILEQEKDGQWTRLGYQQINGEKKAFDLSSLMAGVTFERVGEYEFRVREEVGDTADMDYDEQPKPFTVVVTDADMDGKLEVGSVVAGVGAKVTDAGGQFAVDVLLSNVYVKPTDVKVDIQKTVKNVGNKTIGPEGFAFVLENTQTQERISAVTDANGQASINLHYGLADAGKTFTYTLAETKGETKGVSYDERVYRIEVRVARGGDAMTATVLVDDVAVEACALAFENTYDGDTAVTPPTGDNPNLPFWIVMMILSGTASIVLILLDRRDRKKKA